MIADDLTGACDAAVAFARRGFPASVFLGGGGLLEAGGEDWRGVEMVVLSTLSRDDAPSEARCKVEAACRRLTQSGARLIYKKIDSTLQGNLAEEIEAAIVLGGFSVAFVTPAFPAMERTVVNGFLHLEGRATSLHVPTLLAGTPQAQSKDARSDQDLRDLAAAALAGRGSVLCVGSGGLAAQLAALLAERFGRVPVAPILPGPRGPALFVMGSEQPTTRAQVDYLVRNRPATTVALAEVDAAKAQEVLREGRHLVVSADLVQAGAADAARLLEAAAGHLVSGLVVSGGDTAAWICGAADVLAIAVKGEVLAGIPWGEASTGSGRRWCIVTKAGGFGAQDALARVADFLSGENK
jgi:uncharacterized protein YgbK (DUF1537 family)